MILQCNGLSWGRARISRGLSHGAKVSFVLGMLFIAAAMALGDRMLGATILPALATLPGLASIGLLIGSFATWLTRGWVPGSVEVGPAGIVVRRGAKERTVDRTEIASAVLVARPIGAAMIDTVEITLASGDLLTVRFAEHAPALALVDALGFGPGGKPVSFELATPARRLIHAPISYGAYMIVNMLSVVGGAVASASFGERFFPAGIYVLMPIATLLTYQLLRRVIRPLRVTVGEDGVVVQSAFARRFVARQDIATVTQINPSSALVILKRDGRGERIAGVLTDVHRRVAIGRTIVERLGGARANVPDRRPLFESGGRPVPEWRTHLARMMEDGSYRTAGASVDDAAAIVRSAHATPEQRVGAALALRVAGEPPERIRVVAETNVDDRMREALEAVADGDDERVERALRRV